MLNIFGYESTSHFLRDCLDEKLKSRPSFSIRSWARALGQNSHGPLQQVISGKRKLPKSYIPALVKNLNLNCKQSSYLENLVSYENAKSLEEKNYFYSRLRGLIPKNKDIRFYEVESFNYFKDPLHGIIRTLSEREDFQSCPKWIKKQLLSQYSQKEISEAIDRLVGLGLMIEEDGVLKKTHKHLTNKADTQNSAARKYHEIASNWAIDSLNEQALESREFQSFTFNLRKEDLPEIKKYLRESLLEFFKKYEALPGEKSQTYQINQQLFSITKDLQ